MVNGCCQMRSTHHAYICGETTGTASSGLMDRAVELSVQSNGTGLATTRERKAAADIFVCCAVSPMWAIAVGADAFNAWMANPG